MALSLPFPLLMLKLPSSGDGGVKRESSEGKPAPVWRSFDPSGLERAAKAARELEKSGQ